jgi:uncharacterized YigZ family protein
MEKYYSIEREAENEIVIERSRFITFARFVQTDEEARAFIDEIRKKHSLATHNCYAYVCERGNVKRFSDDGEPSGTAGMPILDVITSMGLVDTAVVVTRYFGGIKLGAGGLVRAYSRSASECLRTAKICESAFCTVFKLKVTYDKFSKVANVLTGDSRKILRTDYGERVEVTFATYSQDEENVISELNETLSGDVDVHVVERRFMRLTAL